MIQPASGAPARLEAADEFVVSFRDRRAAPAKILETIAACGIEVLAHSLYGRGQGDVALLLVTADSLHTALVLRLFGLNYDIEPVVLGRLPRALGNAALLGMRLAKAGVRIQYSYVSWPGGDSLFAVFKTDHDPHTLAARAA